MAENPDRKDPAYEDFIPAGGDLRFVLREVEDRELRILQRWEWSALDSRWAWYDIHLAEEE